MERIEGRPHPAVERRLVREIARRGIGEDFVQPSLPGGDLAGLGDDPEIAALLGIAGQRRLRPGMVARAMVEHAVHRQRHAALVQVAGDRTHVVDAAEPRIDRAIIGDRKAAVAVARLRQRHRQRVEQPHAQPVEPAEPHLQPRQIAREAIDVEAVADHVGRAEPTRIRRAVAIERAQVIGARLGGGIEHRAQPGLLRRPLRMIAIQGIEQGDQRRAAIRRAIARRW